MKSRILFLLLLLLSLGGAAQKKTGTDHYLVKIYHCASTDQVSHIQRYLKNTLIPFLHKNGVATIGVFTPLNNDTASDKQLYVWLPLKSLNTLNLIENKFSETNPFKKNPLAGVDSIGNQAPYTRIETMLSTAFKFMPQHRIKTDFARSADNVYEFRSYESSTENLHLRKVHMFNEGGEIALFEKLNFNALFYARVIAGAHMPNLIYMTRFKNRADREDHWKQFGGSPEWKKMAALPEYANTVSLHEVVLLKAAECSEF